MSPRGSTEVRVFIVDDSAVGRVALRQALAADPRLQIVGEAHDGADALRRIPGAQPDIVLMDIVMPGIDGLEATRELMHRSPLPILIISDQIGGNADPSFEALRAGALEVIGKPAAAELADPVFVAGLCRKVHMLAGIPVITRYRSNRVVKKRRTPESRPGAGDVSLLCLGASTGGPPALRKLLESMPAKPTWPTLVVQHMTAGFTAGMISWLGKASGRKVEMAASGVRPEPGTVYVAPDGAHLELAGRHLRLNASPPVAGHRPSVDALFASVASFGPSEKTVAALLTGMGKDGAEGLELLRQAGAWTIAQDEASCVVYGMPKAAADRGAACDVMALDHLALYLASLA